MLAADREITRKTGTSVAGCIKFDQIPANDRTVARASARTGTKEAEDEQEMTRNGGRGDRTLHVVVVVVVVEWGEGVKTRG